MFRISAGGCEDAEAAGICLLERFETQIFCSVRSSTLLFSPVILWRLLSCSCTWNLFESTHTNCPLSGSETQFVYTKELKNIAVGDNGGLKNMGTFYATYRLTE